MQLQLDLEPLSITGVYTITISHVGFDRSLAVRCIRIGTRHDRNDIRALRAVQAPCDLAD